MGLGTRLHLPLIWYKQCVTTTDTCMLWSLTCANGQLLAARSLTCANGQLLAARSLTCASGQLLAVNCVSVQCLV